MSKATIFRALHAGPSILVLPNAWDVISARIFEQAGFQAIGTTSAGIAASLGYPDGQKVPMREMISVVTRIAGAVKVPVTADVEAGYAAPIETAKAVLDAGAAGLNFEDITGEGASSLRTPEEQAELIRLMRLAVGDDLVINARTDLFLGRIGVEETRFDQAVQRLRMYHEAGADCLFAPGLGDGETIKRLVRALPGPLNILALGGAPPVPDLERLGVARVSIGSGAIRAALGLVERIARELKNSGTYTTISEGTMPYPVMNRLVSKSSPN